jgi:Holliday junction resolvase-like predicted endonuclease
MVKSHIKRKSAKRSQAKVAVTPTALKQITTATTDYIKQWTQRELVKIQDKEQIPVCVPVKNGYKIGLYTLTVYPNKTCDVFDRNQEFVYRFDDKISAILYTIYTIKKKYWIADDLVKLNIEINKHYNDMLSFRRSLERAQQGQDYVTVDVRQTRLEIAEFYLKLARDKLSKIHKTAKYYKIWDN